MSSPSDENPTVLIAEDQTRLLDLYEVYLSSDYNVRSAEDGEEALNLVDENVEVGLLDRRIPNVSGDEVLRTLREKGYQFPIAMLTAVEPDVDIVDMRFDDYIVKPVNQEELLNRVEALVQWNQFDNKSREFFQIASKKAALESSMVVNPMQNPEYRELVERQQELKHQLDQTLEALVDEYPHLAFEMIGDDSW